MLDIIMYLVEGCPISFIHAQANQKAGRLFLFVTLGGLGGQQLLDELILDVKFGTQLTDLHLLTQDNLLKIYLGGFHSFLLLSVAARNSVISSISDMIPKKRPYT